MIGDPGMRFEVEPSYRPEWVAEWDRDSLVGMVRDHGSLSVLELVFLQAAVGAGWHQSPDPAALIRKLLVEVVQVGMLRVALEC